MKQIEAPVNDLRERFILFLAGKPPGQQYDWVSYHHCACANFIREQLTTIKELNIFGFYFGNYKRVDRVAAGTVWARWNNVAGEFPRTYGALLERVRAES